MMSWCPKRYRVVDGGGGFRVMKDEGRPVREPRVQVEECPDFRRDADCCHPWNIDRMAVCFEFEPQHVEMWVIDEGPGLWPCPVCEDKDLPGIRPATPPRIFRCVTCVIDLLVHVRIPIVHCPLHGRREVQVPWTAKATKWSEERIRSPEGVPWP